MHNFFDTTIWVHSICLQWKISVDFFFLHVYMFFNLTDKIEGAFQRRFSLKWMNIVWILRYLWLLNNKAKCDAKHFETCYTFFAVCWWFIHFRICFYFRSLFSIISQQSSWSFTILFQNSIYFTSKQFILGFFLFPFIPCDKHQSCSYHKRILGFKTYVTTWQNHENAIIIKLLL